MSYYLNPAFLACSANNYYERMHSVYLIGKPAIRESLRQSYEYYTNMFCSLISDQELIESLSLNDLKISLSNHSHENH